jgi:hypothetical protein
MYSQESKRVLNLPTDKPNILWLREAVFDLDLDVYFQEAQQIFGKMHPESEMLKRPENA